jgi:HlyD family secretion protein
MAADSSTTERAEKSRGRLPKAIGAIVLVVSVALLILGLIISEEDKKPSSLPATFVARRGPMTISVLESGTIKARDQIIIKNEVEGKTSIISLVSEGTLVKQGDLLVELDASSLVDAKIDQEISVQNAEAAYINAKENLAVVQNQAQSDLDKAELALQFAEQDLKQYQDGEYPNELSAAQNRITLVREELTRARETLKWSQKLFAEKYISQTELEADQLAEKRKSLDLELAKNDLELLQNFTYQRKLAQLNSDVSQAKMALERTTRKAKADVVQAEADLAAKQAEYNRQKDKLAKIEDQIKKTKIYAPAQGLVIYATSAQSGGWRHNVEPLDEGQEVRERQELIYLPTTTSAMAEVDVHEANLEKVRKGLPAVITVDALPGRKFRGRVVHIAPLPDAQSMWMNPDLKVYNTEIHLEDNDSTLRTGMSCQAEIIFERYDDTVYIPVQAVLRVKGEPTVYVVRGGKVSPQKVGIGLDNNRMIRIVRGLEEGDVVSLTPPLEAGVVDGTVDDGDGSAAPSTLGDESTGETAGDETRQDTRDFSAIRRQTEAGQGPPENVLPEGRQRERGTVRQGMRNPSSKEGADGRKRLQDPGSEHRGLETGGP